MIDLRKNASLEKIAEAAASSMSKAFDQLHNPRLDTNGLFRDLLNDLVQVSTALTTAVERKKKRVFKQEGGH